MSNKRPIYRKWIDPDGEYYENFLMIDPSGLMLQISFEHEQYMGEKVLIYQTSPMNPLDEQVFAKYKEVCLKRDWDAAKRKAIKYIKGEMLSNFKRTLRKYSS